MQGTSIWSVNQEETLQKEKTTHSSIFAWEISCLELYYVEPCVNFWIGYHHPHFWIHTDFQVVLVFVFFFWHDHCGSSFPKLVTVLQQAAWSWSCELPQMSTLCGVSQMLRSSWFPCNFKIFQSTPGEFAAMPWAPWHIWGTTGINSSRCLKQQMIKYN